MLIQQGPARPPSRSKPEARLVMVLGTGCRATEDCRHAECRPCVCKSSRFSREAGNLDYFFLNGKSTGFFQMLALNDIIYFKTLHGPNKTHLWACQSIWASSFYTCRVYATLFHAFLLYFPGRTLRSRELGCCPSLYHK